MHAHTHICPHARTHGHTCIQTHTHTHTHTHTQHTHLHSDKQGGKLSCINLAAICSSIRTAKLIKCPIHNVSLCQPLHPPEYTPITYSSDWPTSSQIHFFYVHPKQQWILPHTTSHCSLTSAEWMIPI